MPLINCATKPSDSYVLYYLLRFEKNTEHIYAYDILLYWLANAEIWDFNALSKWYCPLHICAYMLTHFIKIKIKSNKTGHRMLRDRNSGIHRYPIQILFNGRFLCDIRNNDKRRQYDETLSATGGCTTANDVVILQTVPVPKVTLLWRHDTTRQTPQWAPEDHLRHGNRDNGSDSRGYGVTIRSHWWPLVTPLYLMCW